MVGTEQTAVVSFCSSPEQNNSEAMFDITFKEVDKLTRQAETRAHQLGPVPARYVRHSQMCPQLDVSDKNDQQTQDMSDKARFVRQK